MSERDEQVEKHGCAYFLFLLFLIILTMVVNHYHASRLRDLQRRVGQLESER